VDNCVYNRRTAPSLGQLKTRNVFQACVGWFCGAVNPCLLVQQAIAQITRNPGPPAHPFVGHTFKVPTTKMWRYYEHLSHEHGELSSLISRVRCSNEMVSTGPIMKLTLAGDDILVLSHPSDAQELVRASL
jgi:hypothetical protein